MIVLIDFLKSGSPSSQNSSQKTPDLYIQGMQLH